MAVVALEIAQQFVAEVEGLLVTCAFLVAFHFGSSHQPVGLLIFHDVDVVALPFHHACFLFAERAEQVFHQSPIQECTVFVGPGTFQPGELTHLSQGM